nr:unnamed protein product [Spirometra erinaceieuropaei]
MSFLTEVDVTARDLLRSWAVSSKIPHHHLTNLLKIMRQMKPEMSSMPLDARTLLGKAGYRPPVTALGGERSSLEGTSASTDKEVGSVAVEASNSLPSAVEAPIVQRVSTVGGYDELTTGVSDATYRRNSVAYLSAMGGDTVTAFAERLFFTLFSEDVAEFLTFYGRKAGTRGLFDSPVYSVILEVFNGWNKDHHSDRQRLENAFKKAHDRHQRRSGLKGKDLALTSPQISQKPPITTEKNRLNLLLY